MAENSNFFVRNKSIITFLVLEVVALTAFNFGNISYIFGLAGALLAIIGCFFAYEISKDKRDFLWLLLPIAILFIISGIGSFNGHSKSFEALGNISLFLSLPAFFVLGFLIRKLGDVKPKTVLLVVGGGLALITLFGLFSTIVEYGLFYTLIYKRTPNYFYNGIPYDVTKEMYWLNAFEFSEIYIEYGSLFAVLCASFLPGLLFISPKKERNDFIVCASIGGIGLLTLLIVPNLIGIVVVALASSSAFILRFLNKNTTVKKVIGICFLSFLAFGVIFFIVALANAASGFKFTGFLDRVFVSNKIMLKCQPIFEALFAKLNGSFVNLFGLDVSHAYVGSVNTETVLFTETNVFEVELLKEVGLFGTFLFIGFIAMMCYFVLNYLKKSDDHVSIKAVILVLLLSYFAFSTVSNVSIVDPHNKYSYNPYLRSSCLLVVLFLFGYTFMPPKAKEEKKDE